MRKKNGKMCYTRSFDVILLVGLTELKAQIGWIDSKTVSFQTIPSYLPLFLIPVIYESRGRRKGSNTVSKFLRP